MSIVWTVESDGSTVRTGDVQPVQIRALAERRKMRGMDFMMM
jgi:hypothetical protein